MAAPASSGPRWRIPIVVPPLNVVPPQAVRVAVPVTETNSPPDAPTSFEDARRRGFNEGRQYERNGGNRMSAKADDHGSGGHGLPQWLQNLGIFVILLVVGFAAIMWFVNGVNRIVDPTGAAIADLRSENAELRSALTQRGYERGGGGYRTPTGGYRGQGVLSPEEIARRVPHKRTRTAVPCIDGYVKDPGSGQCDLVEWTPGPDPE